MRKNIQPQLFSAQSIDHNKFPLLFLLLTYTGKASTLVNLSSAKIEELTELEAYLNKIISLQEKYQISFREEKKRYDDSDIEDVKIKDVFLRLKKYCALVCPPNGEEININSFILNIYRNNKEAFNAFYIFFIDMLDMEIENNLSSSQIVQEKIVSAIEHAKKHFFEKDIAVAIGYLLDVLKWDTTSDCRNDNGTIRIFLDIVRAALLIILENNIPQDKADHQGINVYLYTVLMHEYIIRENSSRERMVMAENVLKNIFFQTNEIRNPSLYENIPFSVRAANAPDQMQARIFFSLLRKMYERKELENISIYSYEFVQFISDNRAKRNFKLVSFDNFYETDMFVLDKIEEELKRCKIIQMNEVGDLFFYRSVIKYYGPILNAISTMNDFFYKVFLDKKLFHIELTEYQKNMLDMILTDSGAVDSDIVGILDVLKNNYQYLSQPEHSLEYINQKNKLFKNRYNVVHSLLIDFYETINSKYYSAAYEYIYNLISNTMDPKDIIEIGTHPSHIKFKNIPRYWLRSSGYNDFFSTADNSLQLNLDSIDETFSIVDAILEGILKAYFAKQKQDRITNETLEVYALKQGLQQMMVTPKEEPSEKKDSEEDNFRPFLIRDYSLKGKKPISEYPGIKKQKDTESVKNKPTREEEIIQATDSRNIRNNKNLKMLEEAKNYFLIKEEDTSEEKSTIKNPQYSHIVQIVEAKTEREKPLIIAVNKALRDEHSREIEEREQNLINKFITDIRVVRDLGEDGLKSYGDFYTLKMRKVCGKSYRSIPTKVIKTESGAMVLQYDSLILKKNVSKALRSTKIK